MLLKESHLIKLERVAPKILSLSIAYNNTFVMVRLDKPCQEQSIVHFNKEGKVLYEHKYNDIIDTFGQMNDKEVIVLNVPNSKIDIINLEKQAVKSINHQYLFEDTAHMHIYNFPETRTFCVQEKGTFNDHRLKLSYFSYDNLQENSQPVAIYMSKENEWTYDHVIYKGNNHSKIIWFTYKHQQEITFNYFDLRDDPQGSYHTVKALNTLGNEYGINNLQVNIGGIWETKKNQYLICATSNKSEHKAKNKAGIINNNYILDAKLGNDKGVLREAKFYFELTTDGFSFNEQLIDFYGVGNISIFHTFRHDKGTTLKTPIFYVNNETQEIIAQDNWECSCYSSNYYFPGWDGNTIIQAIHDNGDVTKIQVNLKKIMDPKEISLHFLLTINEDFDDDLLQDALQLLHDS